MKLNTSSKCLATIIGFFFIGTCFISVSANIIADDQIRSNIPNEQSTLRQYLDGTPDDCGCNDDQKIGSYGSLFPMPTLIDGSIISDLSEIKNKLPSSVDISNDNIPGYFNWRDHEGVRASKHPRFPRR